MKIIAKTTAVEPKTGICKTTGKCLMAKCDIFLEGLDLTLRGLDLVYDAVEGWQAVPPSSKKGLRAFAWPAQGALGRAIADSAAKTYLALGDDLEPTREAYRNFGRAA